MGAERSEPEAKPEPRLGGSVIQQKWGRSHAKGAEDAEGEAGGRDVECLVLDVEWGSEAEGAKAAMFNV